MNDTTVKSLKTILILSILFTVFTVKPAMTAEPEQAAEPSIDEVINSHRKFLAEFETLLDESAKVLPEESSAAQKDAASAFSVISDEPKIIKIKDTEISSTKPKPKAVKQKKDDFTIYVTPQGATETAKVEEVKEEMTASKDEDTQDQEEKRLSYDHGYVGNMYAGEEALEEQEVEKKAGVTTKLKEFKSDFLNMVGLNRKVAELDQFADYELEENQEKADKESKNLDTKFQFSSGYRVDDMQWNIASDITGSATPNILSELTWDDVEIFYMQAKGQVTFNDHYVLDGLVGYGLIQNGDNQDSDYLGNNRTLEFSRSNNSVDDDSVLDVSGGLGYKFDVGSELNRFFEVQDLDLTLLAGYSYHEQNLNITDGFQTIPALGPFSGLDSTYEAEWYGPWLGFELFGVKDKFSGFFRFEYHFVDYYAEANWNLRTDFAHPKSFEHEADGRGLVFKLGGSYHFSPHFSLDLTLGAEDWETDPGLDRTFFANGTIIDTRLNEVKFESYSVLLGATYYFN